MTGQRRYRFWAGGLAALALVATACGGSSDGGETASTVDANVKITSSWRHEMPEFYDRIPRQHIPVLPLAARLPSGDPVENFTTQVERHAETERQRWYDEAGDRRRIGAAAGRHDESARATLAQVIEEAKGHGPRGGGH